MENGSLNSTFNIQHSSFPLPRYRPAARRRPTPCGATEAATLFTLPHGLEMRTQNCVGSVMGGVSSEGALPPSGVVKSNTGPRYHWYVSDTPAAATLSSAVVPAG